MCSSISKFFFPMRKWTLFKFHTDFQFLYARQQDEADIKLFYFIYSKLFMFFTKTETKFSKQFKFVRMKLFEEFRFFGSKQCWKRITIAQIFQRKFHLKFQHESDSTTFQNLKSSTTWSHLSTCNIIALSSRQSAPVKF